MTRRDASGAAAAASPAQLFTISNGRTEALRGSQGSTSGPGRRRGSVAATPSRISFPTELMKRSSRILHYPFEVANMDRLMDVRGVNMQRPTRMYRQGTRSIAEGPSLFAADRVPLSGSCAEPRDLDAVASDDHREDRRHNRRCDPVRHRNDRSCRSKSRPAPVDTIALRPITPCIYCGGHHRRRQ